MHEIWLAFIPMFFAMDPIGLVPIFAGLTADMEPAAKRQIIIQSLITAVAVAVGFIFLGQAIFRALGITMADFMIAGGIILFCLSILDLTSHNTVRRRNSGEIGAVPIGTPLVVGPAVLTMALILISQHGVGPTLIGILLNIGLVGMLFFFTDFFMGLIGPGGARALSKVLSLLLAAIGVMMIRRGVMTIVTSGALP